MTATFTKLFTTITDSTIWCEDSETRIVWITMLAMSGKEGRVSASIPGLANRAQVSLGDCEKALKKFLSPDKYSRTTDNEGRRIAVVDGGWVLLNYAKYRAARSVEDRKEYKREWAKDKRRNKAGAHIDVDLGVDKRGQNGPQSTQADIDTYTNKPKIKTHVEPKAQRDDLKLKIIEIFEFWQAELNHPQAKLDDKRKRKLRDALKIGYSIDDCKNAILGCRASPHHRGENDSGTVYDAIDLIFRDAEHIDKFIKILHEPPQARKNGTNTRTYETAGERVGRINREAFEKAAAEEGITENLGGRII